MFWGLDATWPIRGTSRPLTALSYSLYTEKLDEFWDDRFDDEWSGLRIEAMTLLENEDKLREIVRLVGIDALSRTRG